MSLVNSISVYFLFLILVTCSSGHTIKRRLDYKPLIIAHRGASGYMPEHTLEAKVLAYMMNADYIEQDLALTKDNIPVVTHDILLDDTTDVKTRYPTRGRFIPQFNATFFFVFDFTLDEIRTLQVSERFMTRVENGVTKYLPVFPNRFPVWKATFHINTFEEELEMIRGLETSFTNIHGLEGLNGLKMEPRRRVGMYVELKRPDAHVQANKTNFSEIVLDILAKHNYTKRSDPVVIQCFDPFELKKIRGELKSDLTLVQLIMNQVDNSGLNIVPSINYDYWQSELGLKDIATFADGIGPDMDELLKLDSNSQLLGPSDLYLNARKNNLFMHPWTFRSDQLPKYAKSYDQLMDIFVGEMKVEGIFTDFPDLAVRYVAENGANQIFSMFSVAFWAAFISVIHFSL